jgi:hypothetical protein
MNWDCAVEGFEGIRAQDILPLLTERFGFTFFLAFGNVISPFVDRSFGHHFDPAREWDRHFIDRVHARDQTEIEAGTITPTHMMAVMRNDRSGSPDRVSQPHSALLRAASGLNAWRTPVTRPCAETSARALPVETIAHENTRRWPCSTRRQLPSVEIHRRQHGHLRPCAGHHRACRTGRPLHSNELGHLFRRHRRRPVLHRQRLSRDRQLRAQPAAARLSSGPGPSASCRRTRSACCCPRSSRHRIHRTAVARLPPASGHARLCRAQPQVRRPDAVATARRVRGQPEERCRQRLDLDLAGRSADVRAGRGARIGRRAVLAGAVQRRRAESARAGMAVSGADADVEPARISAPRRIVRGRRVLLRQPRLDATWRPPVADARRHGLAVAEHARSSPACLPPPKSPSCSGSPTRRAGAASIASATIPTASISGAIRHSRCSPRWPAARTTTQCTGRIPDRAALAVASWHLVEQPALRLKKLPNDIRKRWQAGQSGAAQSIWRRQIGTRTHDQLDLQPAPAASAPASR